MRAGLSTSSTSSIVTFLFRFPEPHPVVGRVFDGRKSAIWETLGLLDIYQ